MKSPESFELLTQLVGVWVTKTMREALERACKKEGRPYSQFVRIILEKALRERGELK